MPSNTDRLTDNVTLSQKFPECSNLLRTYACVVGQRASLQRHGRNAEGSPRDNTSVLRTSLGDCAPGDPSVDALSSRSLASGRHLELAGLGGSGRKGSPSHSRVGYPNDRIG